MTFRRARWAMMANAVGPTGTICAEAFPADTDNPDLAPNRPITE